MIVEISDPLTPSERDIIYKLLHDLDYSEIACELSVTKAAVKFHVINIYSKLGVDNRLAALRAYARISQDFRAAFIASI